MMSGIKGKNTKPELLIRSELHKTGFRFRLHRKDLPDRPDLVFPRYSAVLFVHGCFWHQHDCHLFKWPSTRSEFWREKIEGNVERDCRQYAELQNEGWRIATIWECALKGRSRVSCPEVVQTCAMWLNSDERILEIRGDEARAAR